LVGAAAGSASAASLRLASRTFPDALRGTATASMRRGEDAAVGETGAREDQSRKATNAGRRGRAREATRAGEKKQRGNRSESAGGKRHTHTD
jgi:hypothetical protein